MDNNHHTCGEDHLRYNISKEQKLLNRNFYQVCHNSYPPFLHLFHTYDDVEVLLIVEYVVCVWILMIMYLCTQYSKSKSQLMVRQSKEALLEVDSCFGGMAIYRCVG